MDYHLYCKLAIIIVHNIIVVMYYGVTIVLRADTSEETVNTYENYQILPEYSYFTICKYLLHLVSDIKINCSILILKCKRSCFTCICASLFFNTNATSKLDLNLVQRDATGIYLEKCTFSTSNCHVKYLIPNCLSINLNRKSVVHLSTTRSELATLALD